MLVFRDVRHGREFTVLRLRLTKDGGVGRRRDAAAVLQALRQIIHRDINWHAALEA